MSTPEVLSTVHAQSANAAYLRAVESAAGIGAPQDLRASLDYLQEAAQTGHRGAQTELAALLGNWRLAGELASGKGRRTASWERLREAVDVTAWLSVPEGRVMSHAPRLVMVKKYLSAPVCDWLIRLARPYLRRAEIFDIESAAVRYDATRDNDAAVLELRCMDTVAGFVRARIAALADVAATALEPTQILQYEVGQKFDAHVDFLDVGKPAHAHHVQTHGQRAMTVLVYLNEDYQGGETAFPDVGISFKGRKGDALVFWNLKESGEPDWRTRHIGTAPTRGVKWLLSQWIRIRAS